MRISLLASAVLVLAGTAGAQDDPKKQHERIEALSIHANETVSLLRLERGRLRRGE